MSPFLKPQTPQRQSNKITLDVNIIPGTEANVIELLADIASIFTVDELVFIRKLGNNPKIKTMAINLASTYL